FVLAPLSPALTLVGGPEFCGIAQPDLLTNCKLLRACGHEKTVLALLQDAPRKEDGIADSLHGSNGPGLQRKAVHETRIQLSIALPVEMGAHTRVKNRALFHL